MTNGNSDDNAVPYHSILLYQNYAGHSLPVRVDYTLFLLPPCLLLERRMNM